MHPGACLFSSDNLGCILFLQAVKLYSLSYCPIPVPQFTKLTSGITVVFTAAVFQSAVFYW